MKAKDLIRPGCKFSDYLFEFIIATLRSTGQWKYLTIELVLNAFHSPPGLNFTFYAIQDEA
jgi:hypothetical protein